MLFRSCMFSFPVTISNLNTFITNTNLHILLLNLNIQPTLSSYYELKHRTPNNIYKLLTFNEHNLTNLISHTIINNLNLILSNNKHQQLNTLLLHTPNKHLQLHNLIPNFQPHYNLIIINTQNTHNILLKITLLTSQQTISPITPKS